MPTDAPSPSDPNDRSHQLERLQKLAKQHDITSVTVGDDGGSKDRPQFLLPTDNRELHDFAREVGAVVCAREQAQTGLFEQRDPLFRRDFAPVIVNHENKRLDPMTPELFRTWAANWVACYRQKKIGQGDEQVTVKYLRTMNLDTARGTLESRELLLQAPRIDRVNESRMPVIVKDGSPKGSLELLRPGYFAERGIYTFDDGLKLDEGMSLEEARAIIDDLLQYFPFPNERSKAVAIAAMLTMFCANLLPKNALRPAFLYTANSPGAGKTLLAKIAIIPLAGAASTRTFPRKEEAKKVLDVIAMEAVGYVLFDNIRGKIAGEEIEAFITSPVWEGRILGESTKFRVDNVATVFLTGNQSTTSGDMADRCLFVELFVQEADNRDRKIPHVIDDAWLGEPQQRERILSALWAMVRAWDANDRPAGPSRMPRFEYWSAIVGGIVVNAGYADPIAKPDLPGLGDVEIQDMRELVKQLAPAGDEADESARRRNEWKFADIIDKAVELGLFGDVEVRTGKAYEQMFDENGATPAGKSHFGKLLARYDKRVFAVDGRMLRFVVEGKGNSRRFAVLDETPQQPQAAPEPTQPQAAADSDAASDSEPF